MIQTPRPVTATPADEDRHNAILGAKLAAALTAAHAELTALDTVDRVDVTGAGHTHPGIAVAWDRPPGSQQFRILVGGNPYFPPATGPFTPHSKTSNPDTAARPDTVVSVLYPPGSKAVPIATSTVTAQWASLPVWLRCVGRSDPLWTPGSDTTTTAPRRGGFEDFVEHLPDEFAWLVIAEPLPVTAVEQEMRGLELDLSRLRNRPNHEPDRIALRRGEARFHELARAKPSGLWHLHALVGATSLPAARRAAGLLCSASELDQLPYTLYPHHTPGSLAQTLAITVIPAPDPGNDQQPASPFAATGELVAALARPPRTELPGIEVREPARFDVTPHHGHSLTGGIHLGTILDSADRPVGEFAVSTETLNRHTFVAGATGSGKSQTVRHLLEGLHRRGIPWLVIEPAKAEYAGMAGRIAATGGTVTVIRPGQPDAIPVGLNPLEPEPGFPLQTHIDLTRALFEAAFEAAEPFPQVLAHALTRCYTDIGWDTVLGQSRLASGVRPKYPSLGDLQTTALQVVEGIGYGREITDNIRGFIDVRIGSLRLGTPGRFFEGGYRLDVADLLARNVVLEIEDVGNDTDKAFFIGVILIRLYEHLRIRHTHRPHQHGLAHVTIVEEAHRLLKNTDRDTPAAHAVELFASLLAEIRAYGEGLVVAEQIPSKITPDVVKNTALKIVHRLPAREDRDTLGATMNLDDTQSRHVVSLPPGRAAVFTDGMDRPLRLHIPLAEHTESTDNATTDIRIHHDSSAGLPPLPLAALAAARRLADDHALTLWIELVIVAHIVGGPPPCPRPDWLEQLIHTYGRELVTAAIVYRIQAGIDIRYRGLANTYQPDQFAEHLVTTTLTCLDGQRPCRRTITQAPDEETRWQAGPYRWADVATILRNDVHNGPANLPPHPNTADWRERGLDLAGNSRADQLDALRARPDYWNDPDAGHDTLVTGVGTPPYISAILHLGHTIDPAQGFTPACRHLEFEEPNDLQWLTTPLELARYLERPANTDPPSPALLNQVPGNGNS
ncbi:ATP-binding protein [Nocardia sp. alder85J]|uniref:ATP-binding protein n=1 Tax=Nocardia sp. alder85J TaxID=2862949 RepID=UPI001CD1F890|nr:ATP-binding protein [Nocardia sp. alder85J]MCX4094585.1 DUF853 family protein [Nocardia sp. alder85J]